MVINHVNPTLAHLYTAGTAELAESKGKSKGKAQGRDGKPRSKAQAKAVGSPRRWLRQRGSDGPASKRLKVTPDPKMPSTTASSAGTCSGDAASVSSRCTSTKRALARTEIDRLFGQAEKSIADALQGVSMKNPLYQAGRVITSLTELEAC